MCTVTFVRVGRNAILTSNRDETVARPAIEPRWYPAGGKMAYYPKDPKAGGTWFALSDRGNAIVLLNGASEKHQWQPPYRKSRGLIVLDLIGEDSIADAWQKIDLMGIEPFTLVVYEAQNLYQYRWDGHQKERTVLNANQNYIWSSSPLYPQHIREIRAEWFDRFLALKPDRTPAELFNFHRHTEPSDKQNGLVINRDGLLQTLSITQATIGPDKVHLTHCDLLAAKTFSDNFSITAP